MERTFSERMGYGSPRTIQTDGMDDPLRSSLWNVIAGLVDSPFGPFGGNGKWFEVARLIAREVLRVPIDGVPGWTGGGEWQARGWLLEKYLLLEWYMVYDILEVIARSVPAPSPTQFEKSANSALVRELSAFRFVGGRLTRLTGAVEVKAIEEASQAATGAGLDGVREHLDEALRQLGRRPEPDYRNAIKEAISAVESAVSAMASLRKPDLDEAIGVLQGKGLIHGAMAAAFTKLYGYTSDAGGIRHALLEEGAPVGFDEAKFMVVACSAFCHLLIAKADAAGLLKKRS